MAHAVRSKTCRSWIVRIAVITAFGMSSAAGAADLGANCCSDLDERITELEKTAVRSGNRKIQLQISGTVNRALLYWNDGSKRDVYIVDPAVDNTSFKLDGSAKIGGGWKVGYQLKIEAIIAASDGVDQVKARGEDGEVFKPDRSYFFLDQEKLGRITVGRTNSASRGIDNIELTGAETTDSEIPDWMGGMFLRAKAGNGLLDLRWGDFVLGKFAGVKGELVTYATPTLWGFEASTAWGRDDYWDVALRYKGEWAKTFKARAGIGYFIDTTERKTENVRDTGWGGSAALLHIPTGLNIAYNVGRMEHTSRCDERGKLSNQCRGADTFHYVRGGIVREYISLGPTAIYGEYYRGHSQHNNSDDALVNALALGAIANPTELKSSNSNVWGIGLTQHFENTGIQIYLGYRHHELDVQLIDAGGPIADKGIKPIDIVFSGLKIEF